MKTVNSLLISGILTLPIVISIVPEAKADLIACNTASGKAYISKAWYSQGKWVASGWTHVLPGECEAILIGDMRDISAYVYAADKNWQPWKLPGKKTAIFCLRQSSFKLNNANGRCSIGMIPKTFYRVVSPEKYDYTIRFK